MAQNAIRNRDVEKQVWQHKVEQIRLAGKGHIVAANFQVHNLGFSTVQLRGLQAFDKLDVKSSVKCRFGLFYSQYATFSTNANSSKNKVPHIICKHI